MASITDLDNKRVELDAAIATYTQVVQDFAAGSATQAEVDNAKAAATAKGDEYAKLTGQVKRDNPSQPEDDFFRNPSRQTAAIRDDVRTIMRTGVLKKPMIMVFDTEGDTAGAATARLPLGSSTDSDYVVDWGDGTVETHNTTSSHTYAEPGVYTVKVTGLLDWNSQWSAGERNTLIEISQFGDVRFSSARYFLRYCQAVAITAADSPTFLPGCDCYMLLNNVPNFNNPIGHWDMSNVISLGSVLANAVTFNQDLSAWDVGNVTNMSSMLQGASIFDRDLSGWNVASITSAYNFAESTPIAGTAKMPNFPAGTTF